MVRNRFKKLVCIGAYVTMMFAGTFTTHAANAVNTDQVMQITPGGVNIYGQMNRNLAELTNSGETNTAEVLFGYSPEGGNTPWPDAYVNAIDAAGITNEMSAYDKCVAINNYLCAAIEYGDDGGQWGPQTLGYNDTTGEYALKTGKGLCSNYADAFWAMCSMMGIECHRLGGTANGGPHEWDEVIIDGVTYYVDVTWNDCLGNSNYLMSTTKWGDHSGWNRSRDEEIHDPMEDLIQHGTICTPADAKWVEWAKFDYEHGFISEEEYLADMALAEEYAGTGFTMDIIYNGQAMNHAE